MSEPHTTPTPEHDVASPKPRAWQRMLSGRRLDLLDPRPEDIEIEDIAHGLARVARWNGQTVGEHALSVAQHCLLVEEIAAALTPKPSPAAQLAALLHDAPEYVIGDLISPFKAALGYDYKAFENRLMAAVHLRFHLPDPLPGGVHAVIKQADRIAAYYEATRLAGFAVAEARQFFGNPPSLGIVLEEKLLALRSLPVRTAQEHYLARFSGLQSEYAARHILE